MTTQFARQLRRQQTEFEYKLWQVVRDRRLKNIKFRRQQPIGPYIADFVSFDEKLIIELDGSQHAQSRQVAADERRTRYLEGRGYRVLRFWNVELIENFEGVVETIFRTLNS